MSAYHLFFRHILRRLDPEFCHEATVGALRIAHSIPGVGPRVLKTLFGRGTTIRPTSVAGISFPGHFGLAAGFDKDARVVLALLNMGYTHVEVGTVTPKPQPGNEKPRSFRLVPDRALINRMGFNNEGADAMASRLARVRSTRPGKNAVIGVNIGKNKVTPLENAVGDYAYCARVLAPYASYLAINVSSPNTPSLRALQAVDELRPILRSVVQIANSHPRPVPVFVKIAPDLHDDDIRAVAELALQEGLAGVIATNTTIARPDSLTSAESTVASIGAGGLSGPVLNGRSLEVLDILVDSRDGMRADGTATRLAVISCGGVETAEQVKERLDRGADLVQGYTGMIYEGPAWPGRIHRDLATLV